MGLLDLLREPASACSHGIGLLLALPGTWLLLRRAGGDWAKRVSLLIYGVCLGGCYGASALYHAAKLPPAGVSWLRQVDHVGIYALIAGTYTPIAWNLLRGWWRTATLGLAWAASFGGAGLRLTWGVLPTSVATSMYLVMGWGAIFFYAELARNVSHRTLRLIVVGGLVYSAGAVLNLLQWPEIWPGAFGPHEVFHLFVLGGSLAHFLFILRVVAPSTPTESGAVPRPMHLRRRREARAPRLPDGTGWAKVAAPATPRRARPR